MVERLVDPDAQDFLDLRKIAHHSFVIESRCAKLNFDFAVMSVKIAALAVVVQQPMAVAEMDFLRYFEHQQIIINACRIILPSLF